MLVTWPNQPAEEDQRGERDAGTVLEYNATVQPTDARRRARYKYIHSEIPAPRVRLPQMYCIMIAGLSYGTTVLE